MNKDALRVEYSQLSSELSGISPKLALYAEIKERMKEIDIKLEGLVGGGRVKKTTTGKGKNKRYVSGWHYVHG